MANDPTTIKDLARILKISVSTVSRALRDTHDVNKETREKVMALAQELKYKPNLNATALAKSGTHNIGIILPDVTNYFYSTVITGVQEVAYSSDFNISLFLTNDSPERERDITQNLFLSGLDGLLVSVASNSGSCDHFKQLMDEGLPVVFFASVPGDLEASKVIQDNYRGAFEGVEHLIQSGYSRIAHITGPKGLTFTQVRLKGYLGALEKHNMPIREEWIVYSAFSQESGEKDTYELLKCKERPDAIFGVNDRKAVGAMMALKNEKVMIGKEMGVLGFTNEPTASVISPSLSTIAVPAFDIGRISCELLLKHILKHNKKRTFQPQVITLPGQLIVRESTVKN
ncbi:MAG: periplasmic binding protein/LacI transcriptional regulator [Segetibacter sp.]|nr:periplasmic binding protein/LacI transcriptional regulator [Segetibacter sp.]